MKSKKNYFFYKNGAIVAVVSRLINLLLQLVSLPIMAKALGIEGIGVIAYAQVFIALAGTFIDFGFNITITKAVATLRNNAIELKVLFWSIQLFRALLFLIAIALIFLFEILSSDNEIERLVIFISFGAMFGMLLTPFWLFQGLEKISSLILITLVIRFFAIIAIYLFVKSKSDILLAATILFLAEAVIGMGATIFSIKFLVPGKVVFSIPVVQKYLNDSTQSWLAFVAASLIAAMNPLIIKNTLGLNALGLYSASEKIVRAAHSLIWPIAQALYPRVCIMAQKSSRTVAIGTANRFTGILSGVGFLGFLTILIGGPTIVGVLYSVDFSKNSLSIQIMSAFLLFASLNNAFSYFFLYPNGLYRVARKISFWALAIAPLLFLVFSRNLGLLGASASFVILEFFIVFCQGVVIYRAKNDIFGENFLKNG